MAVIKACTAFRQFYPGVKVSGRGAVLNLLRKSKILRGRDIKTCKTPYWDKWRLGYSFCPFLAPQPALCRGNAPELASGVTGLPLPGPVALPVLPGRLRDSSLVFLRGARRDRTRSRLVSD